jgi:DNA-binding CsgD family transcriptional regulator
MTMRPVDVTCVLEWMSRPPKPLLTPREVEVLDLTAVYGRAETAYRLNLSEQTIKNELGTIRHKLAVHTTLAAYREAVRRGYLSGRL